MAEHAPPADWLEQHPLAHLIYDADSLRLLAVNQAAVERYGYSRDELLAMTRDRLMPPDERAVFAAFLACLPASARGRQRVWRELTRSGQPLRSLIRGSTIEWNGRPVRLSAVMDAEPILDLEEDARRQQELWRVAGAMARLGGWSMALPAMQVTWSDEVCAIHERPRGHRPTLEEALAYYPGEAGQTLRAAVEDCIRDGRPFDLELPFVTASGRQRWVRAGGVAVHDAAGRVVGLQGLQHDITERKQAEQALEASRDRVTATLRAVPDLWFVIDADDRHVEVSDPRDPGLVGPWETVRGRTVQEATPEPLRGHLMRGLREARHGGAVQSFTYGLATVRGEHRHFEGRVVPMADGSCLYLTRDVTAQHVAQAAAEQRAAELQASEQRLRSLLQSIPTLWFVIDADDRYAEVSREDHPDLAQPWAELAWHRLDAVLPPETAVPVIEALRACRDSGLPRRVDYPLLDRAGALRHFSGQLMPMAEGRVLLLAFEVTSYQRMQAELKRRADALAQAHRETQALLRAFPDLWFVVDEANRFVDVRDSADPRLPRPWSELLGTRITEAWPREVGEPGQRALDFARTTGLAQPFECEMPLADGRRLLLDARCVPLAGGRVLMVARDVTAQRGTEAALRARQVAEKAAQQQREFLSRMSHEMRTPLHAILGFGQLLEQELEAGSAAHRQLQHILDGGQRLLELIERLFQLQRLQQLPAPPSPVLLDDCLRRAAASNAALAQRRGVRVELATNASRTVLADQRRLEQLLSSLVEEVLRNSPQGSSLHLETPPAVQPAVLLRNQAVRPSHDPLSDTFAPLLGTPPASRGLGLGLLIAQEFARQLGAGFRVLCDESTGLSVRIDFEG